MKLNPRYIDILAKAIVSAVSLLGVKQLPEIKKYVGKLFEKKISKS